jgi:hypothetical protein
MQLFPGIAFCLFVPITLAQSGLKVSSVFPVNQTINAEAATSVIITFNSPIDTSTITDTSLYIFGRWSGIAEGEIYFDSENKILTFIPEKPFYPGELVYINLSKRIKNKLNEILEPGYAWHFWIKTGAGTMDLVKTEEINVRQPREGWIQTYGAYAGDLDKDGYTDFLVPNEQANDIRVFMNDRSGGYTDFKIFPIAGGSRPSTNEGADFNLDGLMDIAVGNSFNSIITVFLGDGNGSFSSVENYNAAQEVRGLMVIDVDGDGFMDIITANRLGSNLTVLKNNGDGTFIPSDTIETGSNGETTCSAADVNGDGIIDLFVGALSSREVILLLGEGNGSFIFHSKVSVTGQPWFTCTGDMNGDGIADVVSANSSGNLLAVILCDSLGNLSEPVHYSTGSFPLSIDLGDVDGDGDLDVVTSNYSAGSFTLYENDGTGVLFNRRDLAAGESGSCSVFHDRDNDGDLDMTGVDELDDLLILFENTKSTGVAEQNIPETFYLYQNYPNPFNPTTNFEFHIADFRFVSLKVYDVLGREVVTLINEEKPPGKYKINFNADRIILSSGVYFYKLSAGEFKDTKKMILLE